MKKKVFRERYYEEDTNASSVKVMKVSESDKKDYTKDKKKKSDK